VGADEVDVDRARAEERVNGTVMRAGGTIAIDGATGEVFLGSVPVVDSPVMVYIAEGLEAGLAATDDPAAWPGPVLADRRQEGCVRFSYLPPGSRTPRRHRCQPPEEADAPRVRPVLTSEHYPDAAYGQVDRRTADEIRRGADDESEMGVLHPLFQPQRAAYLEARLDDYLRFGLEAGFFFAS